MHIVILIDINMPEISGIEATKKIRALPQGNDVLILGLTGNVDASNLELYKQSGLNGCIAKGKILSSALEIAVGMNKDSPCDFIDLTK